MTDSSAGSSAPVVMTCVLMPETFLRTLRAPSIRGWMLDCPGVAMNSATSPEGTRPWIRLPIATPEANRSWPM